MSFHDYQVVSPISSSPLAAIFHVKHRATGQEFAMKSFNTFKAQQDQQAYRVANEVQAYFILSHPFIANIVSSFSHTDGVEFRILLLDFYKNGDLERVTRQYGGLYPNAIKFYTAELIQVLTYIRSLGYVHGNIKPNHLLLDNNMHLKLCDFSCTARAGDPSQGRRSTNPRDLVYMSPEVAINARITFSTDLWGLGGVIFFLYNCYPPFPQPGEVNEEMWLEDIRSARYVEFREDKHHYDDLEDIVDNLLQPLESRRLGFNSYNEVMSHDFYKNIDWANLAMQTPPLEVYGESSPVKRFVGLRGPPPRPMGGFVFPLPRQRSRPIPTVYSSNTSVQGFHVPPSRSPSPRNQ